MKKMQKRVWSLLLVVSIFLTLLPINAFAIGINTYYLDSDGKQQYVTATEIDSTTATLDDGTNSGWYVITDHVIISTVVNVTGDVKLILMDGYSLNSDSIILDDGASLTIYGQSAGTGVLNANSSSNNNPGIGSGPMSTGNSTVTINGGTVSAKSGAGAGIGSGIDSSGSSTVTINGGTVSAKSEVGAGIGSGGRYYTTNKPNVTITINNGTVNANSAQGAGIGSGIGNIGKLTITIYGGTVDASSIEGAGIGTGRGQDGNTTITINGGIVKSKSNWGAGIGKGYESDEGSSIVTINGGTIDATGHNGIGRGLSRSLSSFTTIINGGSIIASDIYPNAVNSSGQVLYPTKITLKDVKEITEITSLTIEGVIKNGLNDTYTDDKGTFCIWQTDGTEITEATAGGQNYVGSVVANNEGELTDNTKPSVRGVTPVGTSVSVSGDIVITFSEIMNTSAGVVSLDGGTTSLTGGNWIDSKTYSVSYSGLRYSTEYTIAITGFKDIAGNEMAADTLHKFSTIAEPDTTKPVVTSVTPNSMDAAINGDIVINFSEIMNTSAGLVSLDGGTTSLTGGSWIDSKTYSVSYSGLRYSTEYTISIAGFKDMAGNEMVTDSSHSFTTEVEPLAPSVPDTLTVSRGGTRSFDIDFGQGKIAATGAAIAVGDSTIVSIDQTSLSSSGTLNVRGLKTGTTDITVVFHDTAVTVKTVSVTVRATAPAWAANSQLVASSVTDTNVTLNWPTALDFPGIATIYKLFQNGQEISTVNVNSLPYTVSGLSSSTTYTFQVQAESADGLWSTDGPSVTITTKASSSGRGSISSSSTIDIFTLPERQPGYPIITGFELSPTIDNNGYAVATVSGTALDDAIKKARAVATEQGKTINGIGIAVKMKLPDTANSIGITLSPAVLHSLVNAEVKEFQINSGLISISLDLEALKELFSQSTGDVTITVKPVQSLSDEAKIFIGTRPVYEITVSYVKTGEIMNFTSLGKGNATLSIPYASGKKEAVGYLFGAYVDDRGYATSIDGSEYDANTGTILIPVKHFSIYGVGYKAPGARFTDISTHWGKEYIDYVVGRGLLAGTSDTAFSPDAVMSRGMLVTALGRLADVDVSGYTTSSFTDVMIGSTYQPYIEWACKKGIIQGIGNSQFAPERAVTREEIAIIFVNYAKATAYTMPITRKVHTFADDSRIGSYYRNAVRAMQQAGIMVGGSENKFNPKASATRGEVSTMLYSYIKLTINLATAQGWALDDSGQYLYYINGKALIDWQTIDGMRYCFKSTGALKTGWVKDGDSWRFYSGNKILIGWWDIGANSNKTYYFSKDGIMVSGKWLQIDGKWYYFNADGSLARSMNIEGYEVDENGVRKTK